MKKMLPLVFSVSLCSCVSTFQLASVDSPASGRNGVHELIIQNDSLAFTYNFNRTQGPVQVRIENKLDRLVSIDLKRSALIVRNQSFSLAPASATANGLLTASTQSIKHSTSTTTGLVNMNVEVPRDLVYVQPHSFIVKQLPASFMLAINNVPESAFSRISVKGFNKKGREAFFTSENSPLLFRSYLFMTVGDTSAQTAIIEHDFYVSRLFELTVTQAPPLRADSHGDRFLVVKNK